MREDAIDTTDKSPFGEAEPERAETCKDAADWLADQCRFWAGMVEHGMPIVAIVYSGGKSLHWLIRVGAADERTWWKRCEDAKARYCADPEAAYRADVQAMRPAVAVRLAGAIRQDTRREQRLLYLDPEAGIVRNAQERPAGREDTKTITPRPKRLAQSWHVLMRPAPRRSGAPTSRPPPTASKRSDGIGA